MLETYILIVLLNIAPSPQLLAHCTSCTVMCSTSVITHPMFFFFQVLSLYWKIFFIAASASLSLTLPAVCTCPIVSTCTALEFSEVAASMLPIDQLLGITTITVDRSPSLFSVVV